MKIVPLSKATQNLLTAFDEAAQYHGWQRESGTGYDVTKAEASYKEALKKFTHRLKELERNAKKAKGGRGEVKKSA